jgi:hypothetical protein
MIENSKSKVTSKLMKTSVAGEAVKNKKITGSKSRPGEDEIREKAKEIYLQRIKLGEHGTALDDWQKAEKLLMGS